MRALLTGATKGIGLAILKMLISENHDCVVLGRNMNEISNEYKIKCINCDLGNLSEVEEVSRILSNESFDILINNAGYGKPTRFEDLKVDQIQYEVNLNLITPILLINAVLPKMKEKTFGRIVNISSTTSKKGVPYLFSYSASKAAINSVTQSLAKYLAETGITVNSICPGGVDTEMSVTGRNIISEFLGQKPGVYQENMIKTIGIGRLIKPQEIASVVNFLINEKSGFISGQSINVCGTMEVV